MRPVLLVAASGLAREVLTVLARLGRPVAGLLDDEPGLIGTAVSGHGVLGPLESVVEHPDADVILCAGQGRSRLIMEQRLMAVGVDADRYATVVDPAVPVPASCSIGAGSVVLTGSVLTADVAIGRHVVIMPNVTLTHDDVVQDYATLCAGVTLGGTVQVGRAAYVGMAACVREGVRLGSGSVLGMGSVLLQDLPVDEVWAGNPARPLRPPSDLTVSATTESVPS